jgi:hypothetical protein
VTQPTTLILTPTLVAGGAGLAAAGHAFDLVASQGGVAHPNLAFVAPVTVTIPYSASNIWAISDTGALALRRWDGAAWTDAAASCGTSASQDAAHQLLRVPICRTGRFALFGPTHTFYLPLVRANQAP